MNLKEAVHAKIEILNPSIADLAETWQIPKLGLALKNELKIF